MLTIEGLSVSYGGLAALRGVSLNVDEGQFVAIVGPNGAGKTTLFKAVSGHRDAAWPGCICSRDATSSPCRRPSARASRHRPRPRGTPGLCRDDRPRKPRDGRLFDARPARMATQPRPHPDPVPWPSPSAAASFHCRHAVGRRAADAGDRPSPASFLGASACSSSTSRRWVWRLDDRQTCIFDSIATLHREDKVTLILVEKQRVAGRRSKAAQ